MHAAEHIQRISRGKLARNRLKLREDRKRELQTEMKGRRATKKILNPCRQKSKLTVLVLTIIRYNAMTNSNPITRDAKITT